MNKKMKIEEYLLSLILFVLIFLFQFVLGKFQFVKNKDLNKSLGENTKELEIFKSVVIKKNLV
jgi:cell division protein FtsB